MFSSKIPAILPSPFFTSIAEPVFEPGRLINARDSIGSASDSLHADRSGLCPDTRRSIPADGAPTTVADVIRWNGRSVLRRAGNARTAALQGPVCGMSRQFDGRDDRIS